MNTIKDLLKRIETGKEKMRDADEFFAEFEEKINGKLISDTTYVEWLIKFLKGNDGGFFDDDWLYNEENLNPIDQKNVRNLRFVFNNIYNYAEEFEYDQIPCQFGAYYNVKYNDYAFKIGFITGQGTAFFAEEIPLDDKTEFIDFNDVITKNKEKREVKTKTLIKEETT